MMLSVLYQPYNQAKIASSASCMAGLAVPVDQLGFQAAEEPFSHAAQYIQQAWTGIQGP